MRSMSGQQRLRLRRSVVVVVAFFGGVFWYINQNSVATPPSIVEQQPTDTVLAERTSVEPLARDVLEEIPIKGRAPKTGYERSEFGDGWAEVGQCDMRNIMLARYLLDAVIEDGCIVRSGVLDDPYTDTTINFQRGEQTSALVQIDHVVALSDAWQKGAQALSFDERVRFANDPLNLLPVDGDANQKKSNSDAASWLPPNKGFRCQYVARQIAV